MINLDDYEEITDEEYCKIDGGVCIYNGYDNKKYYFKKKKKPLFPKVFKDSSYIITVYNKLIEITSADGSKFDYYKIFFEKSLPLLREAIKYLEENEGKE